MKRSSKKGFTVVELVIVIAIIAILAAVLIPTFASLIQKANISKDTQLVRNLNTALSLETEKPTTMHKALEIAAEAGYLVDKINASASGKEILWDSENNVFCYYDNAAGKPEYIPETTLKNSNVATYKLWKIYTEAPSTQTFSIYWNSDADFTAPLTVGFDAGNNSNIKKLDYTRQADDAAQDVVIRTNSFNTQLTINAKQDTVAHYGTTNVVTITAVAPASYDEFGRANVIEVKDGHVVLTENAVVEKIVVASTEAADKVSINTSVDVQIATKDNNTKIDNLSVETKNSSTAFVADSLKDKVTGNAAEVTEVGTVDALKQVFANGGFIKLTADITGTEKESFVVADGKTVYIDLNGHNITNAVVKKPAIVNNGNLTFTGTGVVLNGNTEVAFAEKDKDGKDVFNANGSHVIENGPSGYLHIINGTFGSDTNVGNAIRNFGNCVIDGGTFAATKNGTGKGYAYVFANGSNTEKGIMVINNATALSVEANGMFAADAGEIIINGGQYSLTGTKSYYMFYGVADSGKLVINGGEFTRTNGNAFYGYSKGDNWMDSYETIAENAEAYGIYINGGKISINGEIKVNK